MGDSNLKLIRISSTLDCTTFHSFNVKKKDFQKLAGMWLAGEMVDHIGIYGSKVAEGSSAFQRRSCSTINSLSKQKFKFIILLGLDFLQFVRVLKMNKALY